MHSCFKVDCLIGGFFERVGGETISTSLLFEDLNDFRSEFCLVNSLSCLLLAIKITKFIILL